MTAKELRQKYLDFFKAKGHAIIPSASLIPDNDPTVLFTTAGMHPLVPYLMGQKHPGGERIASAQKCVRTGDIDEVGDATHHTFFEMLGNWSLGDYFKESAIKMSWEFLTSREWLNLDKNRLAISVFAGDEDAPFDQEAFAIWKSLGVPEKKIAKLPKKNNWWGPAGLTGPCGPDTEMFYWTGDEKETPDSFNDDPANAGWVEIWNDVFMQYNKTANGKYELLKQKNVDTGMGLERILAVMNGFGDNYKTDLFKNLIFKIENLSGKTYDDSPAITKAMRVIADHLKAATFIMGDDKGVAPSNLSQGYVVRRLIRRAIRYGRQLDIKEQSWTKEIAKIVAHDYTEAYPELQKNINWVIEQFNEEEIKFKKTLEQGLREFEKLKPKFSTIPVDSLSPKSGLIEYGLSGDDLFNLYATYGFPIELSLEEIKKIYSNFNAEKGITIPIVELTKDDEERLLHQFYESLKKHQELSRTASAGMFKGGLADASVATVKYHTAAHLLLAALRKVLGDQVVQKGSNITAERLRFDFAHKEKMTDQEKKQVEDLVNQAIKQNLSVACEELALADAKAKGAIGVFAAKYGQRVKVYTIGDSSASSEFPFSREICGGPHVETTGVLGNFKILKEESSSAGIRRIKAILE
ncbi:MAG: alanine--tRNA ligase [Parcubacteria group bacterium]|nr:alanine--tRNA ligase [Parcubacteria group bacterium]